MAGKRVDQALSLVLGLSRSLVGKICQTGAITVKGRPINKSAKLVLDEIVQVDWEEPEPKSLVTPAELPIIFEDDDIVVVNKPVGMAAHTGPGWNGPTVLGALLASGHRVSQSGPPERTGIVHRLDVGTTGAMVVAKSELAYGRLKTDFRYRRVKKIYHTLVQGYPDPWMGTIESPIGRHPSRDFKMAVTHSGKAAVTHYETLEVLPGATLLKVQLETGRTHQIRVHMQAIRHCVVGDQTYGGDPGLARELNLDRQWLHAVELSFEHPRTKIMETYHAPYSTDLAQALDVLRNQSTEI